MQKQADRLNKRYFFLAVIVSSSLLIYAFLSKSYDDMDKISKDLPEKSLHQKKIVNINNDFIRSPIKVAKNRSYSSLNPESITAKSSEDILTEGEELLLRSENKKSELELSNIASQFNKNLSNTEIRKKLKMQLKTRSGNYKNTSLKLAKDQLAKEKNNP